MLSNYGYESHAKARLTNSCAFRHRLYNLRCIPSVSWGMSKMDITRPLELSNCTFLIRAHVGLGEWGIVLCLKRDCSLVGLHPHSHSMFSCLWEVWAGYMHSLHSYHLRWGIEGGPAAAQLSECFLPGVLASRLEGEATSLSLGQEQSLREPASCGYAEGWQKPFIVILPHPCPAVLSAAGVSYYQEIAAGKEGMFAASTQSILCSMPSRHFACPSEANFPQFTMVRQNPRSLISYTSAQAHIPAGVTATYLSSP